MNMQQEHHKDISVTRGSLTAPFDGQVIADFDMTLTRFMTSSGVKGRSSHGLVSACPALGEKFKRVTGALFDKYYPIEVDHTTPNEKKSELMVEWWSQVL